MVTEHQPIPTPSLSRRYAAVADDVRVRRTATALEANGFNVLRAMDAEAAKRIVLGLIPEGSQVHQGASQTLEVTGITDEIEMSGRYEPVRLRIRSMDRATQADEIRRLSAAPDVMLGSVHAVTESGSLIVASASGSQLGPYASGAGRVILVVGTQKIVADLEEGPRRIDEHVFPLEDARLWSAYGTHSAVNKLLVVNHEHVPGRITVVLVDEALGFLPSKGATDHGHAEYDCRARDRPGRERPLPPDQGPRHPRTVGVQADPVPAGGRVHPRPRGRRPPHAETPASRPSHSERIADRRGPMSSALHKLTYTRRRFLGSSAMTTLSAYLGMTGLARDRTATTTAGALPAREEPTMFTTRHESTPRSPGSVSGAPNLPAGFTDTVTDQSTSCTKTTTLRPGRSRTSSRPRSVLRSGRCTKEAS